MLVLSRKKDEKILLYKGQRYVIGEGIGLTIVDVKGDNVRIGIDAPTDITIHREEVYLAIQRNNSDASNK